MEDFEKNRAEYVLQLELQVKSLQAQLAEAKLAEPYLPRVAVNVDVATGNEIITVSFGGKNASLSLTPDKLQNFPVADIVTACVDSLYVNLISDVFKPFLTPEVERIAASAKGVAGAGKW